jgi:hypothetical protein
MDVESFWSYKYGVDFFRETMPHKSLRRVYATPAAGAHETRPMKTVCSTTDLFVGLAHTKPINCANCGLEA